MWRPAISTLLVLCGSSAAVAQSGRMVSMAPVATGASATLGLEVGSGRVVDLHRAAANIFVADPKIVDIRPASASTFFVFGVAPGQTTIAALDGAGKRVAVWQVVVRPSSFGTQQAASAVRRAVPGNDLTLTPGPNGVVVRGTVATPEDASEAGAAVASSLPPNSVVDNRASVTQPTQVLLRVRVVEMSRDVTRQLGVNWSAIGQITPKNVAGAALSAAVPSATFAAAYFNKNLNITAVIDALAQDNSAHLLAEPDLIAMSGQPADFLVGGEFPVPVSSSLGQINVSYKDYGVKLSFVPTVIDDDHIQLHVRPEVSALTNAGAVSTGSGSDGITIPALTIRRADTTVELGSGQSFAIAGMLQKNVTQTDSGLPGIGDLPLVGGLFRTDNFERTETELVIVVTPYLVRPVSDPQSIKTPLEAFRPPNDLERLLLLRQSSVDTPEISQNAFPPDAGFVVQ